MKILRFFAICFLFVTLVLSVFAQQESLVPTLEFQETITRDGNVVNIALQSGQPLRSFDPQDRTQIDLAGTWSKQRFEADTDLSMSKRDEDTLAALEMEINGRNAPDYNHSEWEIIELPSVESEMPRFPTAGSPENYEDGVYYRREVTVPEDWANTHITLNFLAANYITDVWFNSNWIGYHEGGYTPFSFDVSDYVNVGESNTLFIRIDNPEWGTRHDTVPAIKPDWWNYTGVIQGFYLESTPELYIVRSDILVENLDGTVSVQTVLHNTGTTSTVAQLQLTVFGTDPDSEGWLNDPHASTITADAVATTPAVEIAVEAGEVLVLNDIFQIENPLLWSPNAPNLYVIQATLDSELGTDVFSTQFGIRTISTSDHRLLLNGEQIFLAGVARHEDDPQAGRTMTWETIRRDLEIIQALNANFVRTAHYPNHIDTYILMDRMGLLSAVEIPLWQATAVEYAVQEERLIADQMWREMILSNRNRPSIIMWSTNNESREVLLRSAFNERLIEDFHNRYDDGRLVIQSAAADTPGVNDTSQDAFDMPGWTMYFGIFHGSTYYEGTRDFLIAAQAAFPNSPILNTEYGIWSGGGTGMIGQENAFNETFRALAEFTAVDIDGNWREDGFLAGITWWAAFDWFTAHTQVQTMGLYMMDRRTLKPAGFALQEAYAGMKP